MPSCRKCGAQWPHGYATCPNDGFQLVADHAISGMAAVAAVPVSDEDLHPGFIVGEYAIEKKLGEGGMGSVYGARHPLIGKRVAIKVISRDLSASTAAVERFVLEAQAVNQIGNQNIVDIFSFGQLPDGRSYFVMEWLQGESLRERLQRLPLSPSETLDFLDTMVRALGAAHEAGIIHRDLKPDNVFLVAQKGEKPVVKLLDFGLAKLSGPGDTRHERTRTGMVMGTPLYLSPEQARGDKVDGATDIYSLGAMAFEMFTGEVPFNADSAVEIMALHISRPPTPPSHKRPGLPPAVDELVLAMMAKDPRQRPPLAQIRDRLHAMRAMFAGLAGPTANTIYQSPTPMPHQGTPPPSWGQTPPPGHYTMPLAPGQSSHPYMVGQSSHPHMPAPGGGKRVALIAVIALVVIGGVVGVVLATSGSKDEAERVAAGADDPATPDDPDQPAETPPDPTATAAADPTKPADPTPTEATKPAEPATPDPVPETPKLGIVELTIENGPATTIEIDGKVVARKTSRAKLELVPGTHELRAEAPRRKPVEMTITVDPAAPSALTIELPKITRPPRPRKPTRPTDVNAVQDPFAP